MSRSSTAAAQPKRPSRARDEERAAHLHVVQEHTGVISSTTLGAITFTVIFAGLLAAVLFHSVVVGGQLELDQMNADVRAAETRATELRVEVAQLEAPDRVLREAARLGMVFPVGEAYINGFPLGIEPLLPPGEDPFSFGEFDPFAPILLESP